MGLAKIDKDLEIWFLRRQNAKRHILTMAQMTMEGYSWVKYLSQQVLTVSGRTAPPPAPRGRWFGLEKVSRAVTRDQALDERTIYLMAWALRSYHLITGLHAARERLTGSSVDVPTPQVQEARTTMNIVLHAERRVVGKWGMTNAVERVVMGKIRGGVGPSVAGGGI